MEEPPTQDLARMWVEYKPPKKSSEPYDTGGALVQPFTSLPPNVQEWLKGSGR